MDITTQAGDSPSKQQRKRTTSSVLKAMMPRTHQRNPSSKGNLAEWDTKHGNASIQDPMLPPDHPNTRPHLRESSGNRNPTATSLRESVDVRKGNGAEDGDSKMMTRSASSKKLMEKEKSKVSEKISDGQEEKPMKKSKSSTSLSALLSKPRSKSKSAKAEDSLQQNNKENETLLSSGEMASPPIWAQFATQGVQNPSNTTKIPLNDHSTIDEDIALYGPREYSPLKQRHFQGSERPTFSRKREGKPRPKSECLTYGTILETFPESFPGLRRSDRVDGQARGLNHRQAALHYADPSHRFSSEDKKSVQGTSVDQHKIGDVSYNADLTMAKRESRVMTAVAAYNGKTSDLPIEPTQNPSDPELDAKAIESAFESLLDARNVPQNTRDKMRSLDTNIKADFIQKDKSGSRPASSTAGLASQSSSRPSTGKPSKTEDGTFTSAEEAPESAPFVETPKKTRPRSLTFTFSKGDQSPMKKQKSERASSHQRTKSGGSTPSVSSTSSGSAADQRPSFFSKPSKQAIPEDYIAYLKKVQKPEVVEIGKVHKLRQLLRNETVGWVDSFIFLGGMTELVELLYRIIKVEWRVEHEDTLLHEILLCLKALSTTSSALKQLSYIHSKLFPTLLGMLFDKEKKGPSEFTTRSIIITLLYAYLCNGPAPDLASRARIVISYLRDPAPSEEARPPGFIASMHHPRPYRIWHKELDNVIKEVFWIFLHHVNIIPYPSIHDARSTYAERHFPRVHPPVPAAPYIGGVEWDATNYLTAHVDLLNGIIASLPTTEERNTLRQELRDSGFERVMGINLRTCKEKFYGCVHEALSTWVGAAMEDGWSYQDVRQGPKQESIKSPSPKKASKKKDAPPVLEMPKLGLGVDSGVGADDGGWF